MHLANYVLFLLFCLVIFVTGEIYLYNCNELGATAPILKLKRYLFCDYDPTVRPTLDHRNATTLKFGIIPHFFAIDEETNSMELHCWNILHWDDPHLTWNPSEFGNTEYIHVLSDEIWAPDITVYSATGLNNQIDIPTTHCWVDKDGNVKCVPETMYWTTCERDQTWWPYDVQNCTFQFGLWSHSDDEVNFTLMGAPIENGLYLSQFQSNLEWKVVNVYSTQHTQPLKFVSNTTSRSLSVHFILQRHANALQTIYGTVVVGLLLLTLTTLWMDPKCTERSVLGIFNFICHFLCMQDLHWRTSTMAVKSSNLMKLLEGSLLLASLTLILTILLNHLSKSCRETPTWLATSVSALSNSKIGRILLISVLDPKASAGLDVRADDNTTLVSSNNQRTIWKYLTILISWIAFFSAFLTYIILMIMFFPREH